MKPDRNVAGTQAVDRAASLVELVIRSDRPLSFTELSDETGLARSTTSRLLAALERTNLLERDQDGAYVGGQLFALHSALHDPWPQVARIAQPLLEKVGEQTGETVHLGVARGDGVVHIAQVESTYLLSAQDWNQVDVPAHCSALGKVLYAFGSLPMPTGTLAKRTEHTRTRAELEKELAEVRRHRFARTVDELEVGLTGLAAPVEGIDGRVIAAIGISGPTARLEKRADSFGRLLNEQSEQLTALLRRKSTQPESQHGTTSSKTEGAA